MSAVNSAEFFTAEEAERLYPELPLDAHKYSRGEVLVAAGSRRYPGAALLTGTAALRAGAGLVRMAVPGGAPAHRPAALIDLALPADADGSYRWPDLDAVSASAAKAAVTAAGPGWGQGKHLAAVLSLLLEKAPKLVLDADALNLLSARPVLWRSRGDVVMTPHPGEARRLAAAFGVKESDDRLEFAHVLAQKLGCVVLLKGAGTVVADPETGRLSVNTSGCPALATAGSGDVLTGVIAAFLARGLSPFDAARLGAFLHGRAGERLGEGLIADDLVRIPGLFLPGEKWQKSPFCICNFAK